MVQVIYTNGQRAATASAVTIVHPRRKLIGTAHAGAPWVSAIGVLRKAAINAVQHAPARPTITAERVGDMVIDQITNLNPQALHVLAVTFTTLIRTSRHH